MRVNGVLMTGNFPFYRIGRVCSADYKLDGLVIEKGIMVSVPVYTIHHSEEHYPDPEIFDPDRWITVHLHMQAVYRILKIVDSRRKTKPNAIRSLSSPLVTGPEIVSGCVLRRWRLNSPWLLSYANIDFSPERIRR